MRSPFSISRSRHFAHRGSNKEQLSENSKAAFQKARQLGFSGLETDLRCTADGHIVLCHDRSLERLGGPSQHVDTLTRRELEALPLPLYFFDRFVEAHSDCEWILDIKRETGLQVLQLLSKHYSGVIDARCVIPTWHPTHEREARRLFPAARHFIQERECWRAGLSVLFGTPWLGGIERGQCYVLPPSLLSQNMLKKQYVNQFHKRGAFVLAYLLNTQEELHAAEEAGFDLFLLERAYPQPLK